ncbi:hypothetical protein ACFXJ5_35455 [Streptomyces sp. NPDC059373]
MDATRLEVTYEALRLATGKDVGATSADEVAKAVVRPLLAVPETRAFSGEVRRRHVLERHDPRGAPYRRGGPA